MRGPIHRKQTLPPGPEGGKRPGLRLRGRLDCSEGPLGEQMGQEDGSRPGRGLCLYLLHRSRPHSGFWAEPCFKKSNSTSSATSRALFPREPAEPWLGQAGAGMPRPSWHADGQGAMGAAGPGGKHQPGSSAHQRCPASWGWSGGG